jgi:uncharacterized protein (DUF58 family)
MAGVTFTGRGKGMLVSGLVLAGAGAGTGNFVLACAACLVLLVVAAGAGWALVRARRVAVRRTAVPAVVANGAAMTAVLEFTAARPAAGPVLIGGLSPQWADDEHAGGWAAAALVSGTNVLRQQARSTLRGAHAWPPTTVWLPDPFGVAHGVRREQAAATTVVLPRVVPLARLPLPAGEGAAEGPQQEQGWPAAWRTTGYAGPVPREFRTGDDSRRVHWPATARSAQPMVRTEEPAGSLVLDLALDTDPDHYLDPEAYERAITAAASLSVAAAGHGWLVRCRSLPGQLLGWAGAPDGPGAGGHGPQRLLAALAVLPLLPDRDAAMPPDPGGAMADAAMVVGGCRTAAARVPLLRTEPCAGAGDGGSGTGGRPAGTAVWDGSTPLEEVLAALTAAALGVPRLPLGPSGGRG